MKLHSVQRQVPMLQAHNLAVIRGRGDLKGFRERWQLDDQGVITSRLERLLDSLEDPVVRVTDPRGLPMHEVRCARDLRSEDLRNALMPKADAKNGNLKPELLNERRTNPGILRSTGPG